MKHSAYILLSVYIFFAGCAKDINGLGKPTLASDIQKIMYGKWFLTDSVVTAQSRTLSDCDKQSYFEFPETSVTINAPYIYFNGCKGEAVNGIYSLSTYGTVITLGNVQYTLIVKEEENQLILARVVGEATTINAVTETMRYSKRK